MDLTPTSLQCEFLALSSPSVTTFSSFSTFVLAPSHVIGEERLDQCEQSNFILVFCTDCQKLPGEWAINSS